MHPEKVSADVIAETLGKTVRSIHKRAAAENWPFVLEKNGRGRSKKYFFVESLPEGIRAMISQPPLLPQLKNASPSLYKEEALSDPDEDLSLAETRRALARCDFLRMYLQEKAAAKDRGESVVKAGKTFCAGWNTGQLHPQLFETVGRVSYATAESWKKRWFESGCDYRAIACRYGNRRGQRKVTEDEFNTALSFALHPNRLRMNEITRLTKMSLRRRGLSSPSSESTIQRALNDWKSRHYDQWIFCREGEKALNDKVLPYIERDAGLLDVGEVLVADGHKLNFQILHPFTGKPCRMNMLMWYDWASCYPCGWEIMPTETVQAVAASLRHAILTIGKMPTVAYLDNGKAFKAKIFTDPDVDFEAAGFFGMFARLGIETIFAWPYNAQAKPIERWFGTFNELERLMPTYTGASIQDKPAHMLRNERLHRKMHERRYGGWVPTIAEANEIIRGWVAEYASRPHQGLKGLCPGNIVEAGRGPGVDPEVLRMMMMSMEIRTIYRNGIRFMGRHYYDEALYGYKDRVIVRYDLDDLSKVYVYDITGKKEICVATPVEPVHPVARIGGTKDDLAAVRAGIARKRRLKKATEQIARDYVESAPTLVPIPDKTSTEPAEPLPEPARLPQAEAERIEREAAEMKVLELPVRREPYLSDADHYEDLLERECRGETLPPEEYEFMRAFEKTQSYRDLEQRFQFLRELYLAGPETEGVK